MKRVIVIGAGGFIGKALIEKLASCGYEVYAVLRDVSKLARLDQDKIHPIKADYSTYSFLSKQIPHGVESLIYLAWQGVSGEESLNTQIQEQNIHAAVVAMHQANLLDVKKFLFAGSSYQYRMQEYTVEGASYLGKINLYGSAKQACVTFLNAMAHSYGVLFNSFLFTNVFGVGDFSRRTTNTFLTRLMKGEALDLIEGNHFHDWTYIDDAVRGIISVLEQGHPYKEYYIGNRNLETFKSIVTRTRNVVCPKAELRFGKFIDNSFIDYTKIDLDALYYDTGFECKADFEESIRKTALWLESIEEESFSNI